MGTPGPTPPRSGQWMALTAALLGWMFDGFEIGIFPPVAKPALRELLGPDAPKEAIDRWFGIALAGFLIGAAAGGVVFGWLGDRLGRVRAMSLSVLTYALCTGLCGLATSPREIIVYRFLASLGMGGEWALGVALVMEVWPDKSRAWLAGVIGSAANLGFFLVALVGYGLNVVMGEGGGEGGIATWRILMFCGAAPALLTFFIRLCVPESARWEQERARGAVSHWAGRDLLAVAGAVAGAIGVVAAWSVELHLILRLAITVVGLALATAGSLYPVARYLDRAGAAGGVTAEQRRLVLRRMLLAACLSAVPLLGTWGSNQWTPQWARTLPSDAGVSPDQKATLTQMVSGMGAVVSCVLAALLGGWIGRRPAYALLCVVALGASVGLFQLNTAFGPGFLGWAFFGGFGVGAFYGWIPLYLPELFPTVVRSTAQGFGYNFGRLLTAIGVVQTANLLVLFDNSYPAACTTVSLIYLVGLGLIWFAPETHGRPLPD